VEVAAVELAPEHSPKANKGSEGEEQKSSWRLTTDSSPSLRGEKRRARVRDSWWGIGVIKLVDGIAGLGL
jgi:hypothetical protein